MKCKNWYENEVPYSKLFEEAMNNDKELAFYFSILYAINNERIKTLSIETIKKYSGGRNRDIKKLILKMRDGEWFDFRKTEGGFIFKIKENDLFHKEYAFMSQLYRISKPSLKLYLFLKKNIYEGYENKISRETICRMTGVSRTAVHQAKSLFMNLGLISVKRYKQSEEKTNEPDSITVIPYKESIVAMSYHKFHNQPEKFMQEIDFKKSLDRDDYLLDYYKILTSNKVKSEQKNSLKTLIAPPNFCQKDADFSKFENLSQDEEFKAFIKNEVEKTCQKIGGPVRWPNSRHTNDSVYPTVTDQASFLETIETTNQEEIVYNLFDVLNEEENITVVKNKENNILNSSLHRLVNEKKSNPSIKTVFVSPVKANSKESKNKMNTQDCVLYIYETWNKHVKECGGFLKPTPPPHSFVKYGSHGAKNSLPNAIADWVIENYSCWQETWDSVIEKSKTNKIFNGKQCLDFYKDGKSWTPTLKWFFKNRDMWNKDMGLNSFLDGDFNTYDELSLPMPIEMAVSSIVDDWNANCGRYKWQSVDIKNSDNLKIAIANWAMANQDNWRDKWDLFLEKVDKNKFLKNEAFDKYIVNLLWLFKEKKIEDVLSDKYRTFDNWSEFKSEILNSRPVKTIDIFAEMKK